MGRNKANVYTGPWMTGLQYEALCRYVISQLYGLPLWEIRSGYVSGMTAGRVKVRHQIDLHWKVDDGVCEYTVFANAKWRKHSVQVGDLMEVMGVWRDIGFHKAMIITNSGFDVGVRRQAEAKGIALLEVRPVVDMSGLGTRDVGAVVEQVAGLAKGREVYAVEVVHKGWGVGSGQRAVGSEGGEGERGGRGEGETRGEIPDFKAQISDKRMSGEGEKREEGGQGDKEAGGQGEGDGDDLMGGWYLMGGGGGEGGGGPGVPDKGMGGSGVRNKMMGG